MLGIKYQILVDIMYTDNYNEIYLLHSKNIRLLN